MALAEVAVLRHGEHGHWHVTAVHGSTYIITEGLWTWHKYLGLYDTFVHI
jgi:hypothetical protein